MNNKFWFEKPAEGWRDGFPIGTGRLAAMILGNPDTERILINHEWLWRGNYQTRDTEPRFKDLNRVRELLTAGEYEKGTLLANKAFAGAGGTLLNSGYAASIGMEPGKCRVDPYQPAGDLLFRLDHGPVVNYRRELDLSEAVARVIYTTDEAAYTCEYIAHPVHDLIMVHITAASGTVSGSFQLDRVEDTECMTSFETTDSMLLLEGVFQEGLDFRVEATIRNRGGKITRVDDRVLRVTDAEEILIFINAGTSAKKEAPAAECRRFAIPDTGWKRLLEEHIQAYQKIYKRLELDIKMECQELPTDKRLSALTAGGTDPGIPILFFNYGRYLLYAASATAELPANIQGKWNGELDPPWGADYHNNVNVQLCYWQAEPAHLQEFTKQLFDYIERFVPRARKAARDLYGCRGVLFPLQTDPWGRATPEAFGYAAWIGGAAWLAQHLWQHYEYGRDRQFLRDTAYPFIREVAAFYEDYLIEDADGILQIVPSQSPENRFIGSGEIPVSLCVSATADVQLAAEVLVNAAKASGILQVDAGKRERWEGLIRRLPEIKTGSRGQLLEWNEEFEEAEPLHRHLSHLYGLFPGDQITPDGTPDLFKAAGISLEGRLTDGTANHPLLRAWVPFIYARLQKGDRAWESMMDSIIHFPTKKMFRLDVLFGIPAVVCQLLLQDSHEKLHFLPALPSAWPHGSIRGIRARGGYLVNMEWKDGQLAAAEITSIESGVCMIRVGDRKYEIENETGNTVEHEDNCGEMRFKALAARTYLIRPVV